MTQYGNFKVLLDDPAEEPSLDFDEYARAFDEIISRSSPQFAIGIFGDWGSGKTTLMRAVWRRFDKRPDVVRVWFNPWRYEREEHLIVPMLDLLREALVEWSDARPSGPVRNHARRAAESAGRAARALLTGISLRAKVPLGFAELEASLDPAKVMSAIGPQEAAEEPSSFYHASFNAMKEAVDAFVRHGVRRIVVFVDDLDRCLPLNALQVLESMKLFFDLEGFVFVVGLDQDVIERAIEVKYGGPSGSSPNGTAEAPARDGAAAVAPISGADYVKKIFQVPFALPRIGVDEIPRFFGDVLANPAIPPAQASDFRRNVSRHLEFLAGDGAVNPREVKRLLNAYTLQLKMLEARHVRPNPHVVLALQTMAFRREWRHLYDRLLADPQPFAAGANDALRPGGADAAVALRLPREFLRYVRGVAAPLLTTPLEPYIRSAEATRSSDPGLLAAQNLVGGLLRRIGELNPGAELVEAVSEFHGAIEQLRGSLSGRDTTGILPLVDRLEGEVTRLDATMTADALRAWVGRVREPMQAIEEDLRALRRQRSVGATA